LSGSTGKVIIGTGDATAGVAGDISILVGSSNSATGGSVNILAGSTTAGSGVSGGMVLISGGDGYHGGSVTMQGGSASGGSSGGVVLGASTANGISRAIPKMSGGQNLCSSSMLAMDGSSSSATLLYRVTVSGCSLSSFDITLNSMQIGDVVMIFNDSAYNLEIASVKDGGLSVTLEVYGNPASAWSINARTIRSFLVYRDTTQTTACPAGSYPSGCQTLVPVY
jgi:hypothetical protein